MQHNAHLFPFTETKEQQLDDFNANTGLTISGQPLENYPDQQNKIKTRIKRNKAKIPHTPPEPVKRTKKFAKQGLPEIQKSLISGGENKNLTEDLPSEQKPPKIKVRRRAKDKRKYGSFTRRLWDSEEDQAIIKLVKKHGIRKWTLISRKLQEEYQIHGRSGKQCRERYFFSHSFFYLFIIAGTII